MKFLLISARVLCSISPLYLLSSSLEDLSKLPCHDNTLILEENDFDFISELNAKNVQVIPRVELNQSVYSKYTANCKATKFSGSLSELKQNMQDEYFIIASLPFEQVIQRINGRNFTLYKQRKFRIQKELCLKSIHSSVRPSSWEFLQ
jgi:hypothetical protein